MSTEIAKTALTIEDLIARVAGVEETGRKYFYISTSYYTPQICEQLRAAGIKCGTTAEDRAIVYTKHQYWPA